MSPRKSEGRVRFWCWILALAILMFYPCPVRAAVRETLAVKEIVGAQGDVCTRAIWTVLLRSQRFNIWPQWYFQGQSVAGQGLPPELVYLVEGRLVTQGNWLRLSVAMSRQQADSRELVFADSQSAVLAELPTLCQEMGYRLLGQAPAAPPDSPALAASLSLVIPGAGHFYQAKPLDVLLGTVFLSGFLLLTYLGLSPQEEGGLTRQQWGGLLMLLSLSDLLSAYFLSMPPPTGSVP